MKTLKGIKNETEVVQNGKLKISNFAAVSSRHNLEEECSEHLAAVKTASVCNAAVIPAVSQNRC